MNRVLGSTDTHYLFFQMLAFITGVASRKGGHIYTGTTVFQLYADI